MKKILALTLIILISTFGIVCKSSSDRWTTTEDVTVEIDWDKVMSAYKDAEGPKDFEEKVNEIYEGDELISVSVQDDSAQSQLVTGFFDKNNNGKTDSGEKVFSISRNIEGERANYDVQGYGAYHGYHHSGFFSVVAGVLVGSMLWNAMRPGYAPMNYATSPSRRAELDNHRNNYRAKNPDKYAKDGGKYRSKKVSQSGKKWGSKGSDFNRSRSKSGSSPFGRSGGGSFGKRISAIKRKLFSFLIKRV